MVSAYAWVITGTATERQEELDTGYRDPDAVGIAGPSGASPEQVELARTTGHRFRLYDDDGIFYYEGRLWTESGTMDEIEAPFGWIEPCAAPLTDFGTGYAGCTDVRWPGHPEWDCG